MAGALIGDAFLGSLCQELLRVVGKVVTKAVMFKSILKRLESVLNQITPIIEDIERLNKLLERPKSETEMFQKQLEKGLKLLRKCEKIKWWNYVLRPLYTNRLEGFEDSLLKFFQIDVQCQISRDSRKILVCISEVDAKLGRLETIGVSGTDGFVGCCGVPEFVVGFDEHSRELKKEVIKGRDRGVVVSAPGGCGKTTFAKMICYDEDIVVPVPVALHSHASSVTLFNGHNFPDWHEQIQFHLGVLDLDLSLQSEKPTAITDASTDEEKYFHDTWERSNRLSLMFMRMSIVNNIKSTLPKTECAKDFMKSVEERSETADKSLAGTLMATLTTMKFDSSRGMYEHVTEMTSVAAKLKALGMAVDESFLMQFIINSLPPDYSTFQMNYNIMKDKWNVNELQNLLVREERRLKNITTHSVNFLNDQGARKKTGSKKLKGKRPLKVNESSSQIHKKGFKNNKCHFCGKHGHFQKDCLKRKAWFEKKGIPYDPNHKSK